MFADEESKSERMRLSERLNVSIGNRNMISHIIRLFGSSVTEQPSGNVALKPEQMVNDERSRRIN